MRAGYTGASYYLPLFVAVERGFFRDEGLEVGLTRLESSNQIVDGVAAGKLDFGAAGFSTLFAASVAAPGRFRAFGAAVESEQGGRYQNALLVRADSNITSVSGLRGKRVGTYTGTTQLLWLRLMLPKMGLIPGKDVDIVQVGMPLQLSALAAGQFDALFTIEPTITSALAKGDARVLLANPRGKYVLDPFPGGPLGFFSTDYLQRKSTTAAKVRRALERAAAWIGANEGEAKLLLPKYTPIDASLAPNVRLYSFERDDKPYRAGVQRLADILSEGGELKTKVDTAGLWMDG